MPRFAIYLYNTIKSKTWLLTLLFCLACAVIILFIKLKLTVSYLPDISGSERSTTFGIQLVADGRPLYYNPEVPPFWITNYAPAYIRFVGTIYKALGWDPANVYKAQLLSRIVSSVLVMLSMCVVFWTAFKVLKVSLVQNLVLCCLFFGLLQHWHLTNSRVDSLLLLCTTVYLFCVLRGVNLPNLWNRYFILACGLAVFAFFVKQSGIIHIIVLLAYLVMTAQWRIILRTVPLMAILFFALTLLFDEGSIRTFFENLYSSVALPLWPSWFYGYTFRHLIPAATVLIAVTFLISLKWLFTSTDGRKRFLGLAAFLFFGFATATAFKHGAAVGYFHEFAYTGLLMIFWYFWDDVSIPRPDQLRRYLFPALVCLTMVYFVSTQLEKHLNTNYGQYVQSYQNQLQVKAFVEPQLTKQDYVVVLMGDDYRGWLLQQMLFRHQLAYTDDIIRFLYLAKKYDFSQFATLVKRGGIKFIVTSDTQPLYINAFNYTMNPGDYVLQKEIAGYHIYKHK